MSATSASANSSCPGWRTCSASSSERSPIALTCSAAGGCSSSGCPTTRRWCSCSRTSSGPTRGLLEFIDYLLEWSADRPLFVLALGTVRSPARIQACMGARSDLAGAARGRAMRSAARGNRRPDSRRNGRRRCARAPKGCRCTPLRPCGCCSTAASWRQEGNRYQVAGDVGELDVPETLHALSAQWLDGLTPGQRAVLQDASVFGQSFTPAGVAALSERAPEAVTEILDGLVAKQVVGFNDDRLSSERGQYHFLQGLLRTTAYGTPVAQGSQEPPPGRRAPSAGDMGRGGTRARGGTRRALPGGGGR